MSAGKGDKRRPRSVSLDVFDKRWEAAFGKKPKEKCKKDCKNCNCGDTKVDEQ